MKLNYKLPLIAVAFLASSLFSGYSQGQTQKEKQEKKTFNFLERTYIKINNLRWGKESDISKLEKLTNICDENGKKGYNIKELCDLELWNIDREYAELINEKDEKGKNVFDFGDIMKIKFFNGDYIYRTFQKDSPQDIIKILKYKDKEGNPLFSKFDLFTYLSYNIGLKSMIEEIDSSKNENPKEIAKKFYREKIKEELKKSVLDSIVENFIDTKKPNALIIHPYSDWNGVFKNFIIQRGFCQFDLKKLKKDYDIKLSFSETEKEVYSAIKEIPNIELLVICGHGSKKSLSLGDTDKRVSKSEKSEEYSIDFSDEEFKEYLDRLNKNAVIFLNSCSNAKENLFNKKNLAKFISTMAENKKVVAWKKSFSNDDLKIKNCYPFEITDGCLRNGGVYYVDGKKEEIK